MIYFIQVNKETKRVEGYSSSKSEMEGVLEIEIDSSEHEELIQSPTIFIYNEADNSFIKDEEYKKQLIKDEENRLSDSEKIKIVMEENKKLQTKIKELEEITNALNKTE